MESVSTTFLVLLSFPSYFEPGQLVLNWLLTSSSGKGTHDEAFVGKPPPIVIPKIP
jgi:hypothetical protein